MFDLLLFLVILYLIFCLPIRRFKSDEEYRKIYHDILVDLANQKDKGVS